MDPENASRTFRVVQDEESFAIQELKPCEFDQPSEFHTIYSNLESINSAIKKLRSLADSDQT